MNFTGSTKLRHFGAVFVIFLSAIVALKANPFAGEIVGPFRMLRLFPGWLTVSYTGKQEVSTHSDSLDNQFPNWRYFKKEIRSGRFPYWHHGFAGGVPGALSLTNEAFSPFFWPFVLIEDDGIGLYLALLAKLCIAGTGMYFFLSFFTGSLASLFAASVFMLCGFHAAWFYVTAVSVSAFIPWLLGSITGLVLTGRRTYWLATTASALGLILGGFPSVAGYGFYLASAWALVLSLGHDRKIIAIFRQLVLIHLFIGLAFAIAAVPLWSLMQQLSSIDLSYRNNAHSGLQIDGLRYLIDPFDNSLAKETTFYLGRIPLVFALLAIIMLAGRK